jgi:MscS family membrane protein
VQVFARKVIGLLYVVSIAWFLYNLIDIVEIGIRRVTTDQTIIHLIRKALRIFLLVVFGLFVAQNVFEQNISAWLAGLGLAGLAVSLAAQGPIKNIFGSVTVVLDRPFGLGDRIKIPLDQDADAGRASGDDSQLQAHRGHR